jgi:hypothetical protein
MRNRVSGERKGWLGMAGSSRRCRMRVRVHLRANEPVSSVLRDKNRYRMAIAVSTSSENRHAWYLPISSPFRNPPVFADLTNRGIKDVHPVRCCILAHSLSSRVSHSGHKYRTETKQFRTLIIHAHLKTRTSNIDIVGGGGPAAKRSPTAKHPSHASALIKRICRPDHPGLVSSSRSHFEAFTPLKSRFCMHSAHAHPLFSK